MPSESPIVQIPEPPSGPGQDDLIYQQTEAADDDGFPDLDEMDDALPETLKLDLRGKEFTLDRDVLVNLPESLLIAMFPNGLVVGEQDDLYNDFDQDDQHQSVVVIEGQVNRVDFDPSCLEYVLGFYDQARVTHESVEMQQQRSAATPASLYYPLLTKQSIIVLREELEYYCIPSGGDGGSSSNGDIKDMNAFKLGCGQALKEQGLIFDALQKNISRENNVAEQHLIDMLCGAGFTREDQWGYREMEPTRTCIVSMALVLLHTTGPNNHMATAQKLMLFWRKPARKCWWDGTSANVQGQSVRLWARRTWTLELALV